MTKISKIQFELGCDPEFFITRYGHVVGSETSIGKGLFTENGFLGGKVVPDGIPIEINPYSNTCRDRLSGSISRCFRLLVNHLETKKDKAKLSSKVTIEVSKRHFDSLPDTAKAFGCSPSFNLYDGGMNILEIDPQTFRKRSAGGHIHMGYPQSSSVGKILRDYKKIIPVLDTVVGNTAVLLDRDDGNKERRQNYGKAGEYRPKDYGLEYRTPSNFWLRGVPLYFLVFGLARQAVMLCHAGLDKELMKKVNIEDVKTAINENDFDMAKKNFDKIKDILVESSPTNSLFAPLRTKTHLEVFEGLVSDGIDKVFGDDLKKTWVTDYHNYGWENYYADKTT